MQGVHSQYAGREPGDPFGNAASTRSGSTRRSGRASFSGDTGIPPEEWNGSTGSGPDMAARTKRIDPAPEKLHIDGCHRMLLCTCGSKQHQTRNAGELELRWPTDKIGDTRVGPYRCDLVALNRAKPTTATNLEARRALSNIKSGQQLPATRREE